MKATDELKNEHQGIELMLRVLKAIARKFGQGEPIDKAQLDDIIEFLAVFVDKCHHGKEEEFLFPALEAAGVQRDGGPIGVMLSEHEQGRKLVAEIKGAVARYTSGGKSAAPDSQTAIADYVALLTQHIVKENTVLFPMADAKLTPKQDDELFEAFEKLERDRIGEGTHEAFHALLDQLQDQYLR